MSAGGRKSFAAKIKLYNPSQVSLGKKRSGVDAGFTLKTYHCTKIQIRGL